MLVVDLFFFFEFDFEFLFDFLDLVDFLVEELFLFSEFFFEVEQVGMSGDFLVDFFDDFFSLSVLKDHSSHLNVELVVNFSLHTLIH